MPAEWTTASSVPRASAARSATPVAASRAAAPAITRAVAAPIPELAPVISAAVPVRSARMPSSSGCRVRGGGPAAAEFDVGEARVVARLVEQVVARSDREAADPLDVRVHQRARTLDDAAAYEHGVHQPRV